MISERHESILDLALKNPKHLNDWERKFTQSVDKKRQYELSEKQAAIMDKIEFALDEYQDRPEPF